MATKNRTAPAEAPGRASPWNWAAEWSAQQVSVATEASSALWQGFGALRRIHDDAVQQASQRHVRAAERLASASAPADLFAIQSEMALQDLQGATRYWQDVADAALEMNARILGCSTHLVDTEDAFAPLAARFLHA